MHHDKNRPVIGRIMIAVVFAAVIATLSGCHTWGGLGKDMESAGEKMQDQSHKHD